MRQNTKFINVLSLLSLLSLLGAPSGCFGCLGSEQFNQCVQFKQCVLGGQFKQCDQSMRNEYCERVSETREGAIRVSYMERSEILQVNGVGECVNTSDNLTTRTT